MIGPEFLSSEPVSKVASGNHGNVTRHAAVPRPISRYARSSMRPGNTIACISCPRWTREGHQPTQRKRRRFHWFRTDRTGPARAERVAGHHQIFCAPLCSPKDTAPTPAPPINIVFASSCSTKHIWVGPPASTDLNAPLLLLKNEKVSDAARPGDGKTHTGRETDPTGDRRPRPWRSLLRTVASPQTGETPEEYSFGCILE